MTVPRLENECCTLLSPQDADPVELLRYELRNREYFTPWVPLRTDDFFHLDAQKQRLENEIADERAGKHYRFYVVLRAEPQRVIGDAGLSNIVRGAFQSAYLGYKLDEHYQRKGIMFDVLSAILRMAFNDIGLHRVEANIMPRNARSIALAERLGMQREGYSPKYLCINGAWEDHVRYAIVKES